MSKIIAMLITVSTLFLPSIIQAKPISIKVAYENNPGEPLDVVMRYWADLLNKKSNGEITLALYPSSQLGSKQDVTEQAMMGMNVITLSDVAFLADYEPDLGILFGPYLTDDPQKLFKIYESDWFKQKNESLKKKGIHVVMNNYLYGTRQIISKKPIRTVDDLAGLKIRVPNNVMQIKAIQAMGATPTPMPLGEVYPALTQGVIDGVENPISVLQTVGGLDLAGLCGLCLGGAYVRLPVLLDGLIADVAALCAVRLCPQAADALLAGHVSAEPGAQWVLQALGLRGMIQAEMRLGEGTGAVAALPLLDLALAVYQSGHTFAQLGIEAYTPQ